MRGLTIVVAEASATRLRSALGLALSHAALGGPVRLFLDTAAVPLARTPIVDADDGHWIAAGWPSLAALIEEALEAGMAIGACQGGLAIIGADAGAFDARIAFGGMVGLLAGLGEDRLVVV